MGLDHDLCRELACAGDIPAANVREKQRNKQVVHTADSQWAAQPLPRQIINSTPKVPEAATRPRFPPSGACV